MASKKSKPVWYRPPPSGEKHKTLSPAKKAAAKSRAKRAGRPYPNLVDNMRAAKGKKRSARKHVKAKTAKNRKK